MAVADLRSFISNYVSLTDAEYDYCESFFEKRKFKKNVKLLQEGEVEKHLNFIVNWTGTPVLCKR